MHRYRAFSLLEILVVLVILALILALLMPVLSEARKEGRRGAATIHGRQTLMALLQYREAEGKLPNSTLDQLHDAGHLQDTQILREPGDEFRSGYYGRWLECSTGGDVLVSYPCSWEYLFRGTHPGEVDQMYDLVMRYDSNPGLIALRTLGNRTEYSDPSCEMRLLSFRFDGPMIRAREDGSVERAQMKFDRVPDSHGSTTTFCAAALFTDNKEACRFEPDGSN
ncbi:MAG: prepilin-type N-terminal cleavage/methylation domain-containing protein [Fimbriimonadaceae bacterium]|nr:prepilin-type N-terminal cleavage/methylation domain-containing protein [Fimbriimonadaceae bacterium]